MGSAANSQSAHTFSIPCKEQPGDALDLGISAGEVVFIVGPNGAGKSALVSHLVGSVGRNPFKRISAHRQNWLSADMPSFAPSQRVDFERHIAQHSTSFQARFKEELADHRIGLSLSSLMTAENEWLRTMYGSCRDAELTVADFEARNPSPLQRLNRVLRQGALGIEVKISPDDRVVAHHGTGNEVGISRLSDGERNAILLAADVLTAAPGTVVFIDEPERHLHHAITEPMLAALFVARGDCMFVIATHEIALPASAENSRTLVLRSTAWNGESPSGFEVELLTARADLPRDLRAAILGSRRRLVFVEGDATSLDLRLYGILFPRVTVTAKGGCHDVIDAVDGLRSAENLHWIEAYGLIDRDNRPEENITKLSARGIYALGVCSVESLFFGSKSRQVIAEQQGKNLGRDAHVLAAASEAAALNALRGESDIRRLCALRCERSARDNVLGQLPKAADLEHGTMNAVQLDIGTMMEAEIVTFKELLSAGKLDELMARYQLRRSGCYAAISSALLFAHKSHFEDAVIALASTNRDFRRDLRLVLAPLTDALSLEDEIPTSS